MAAALHSGWSCNRSTASRGPTRPHLLSQAHPTLLGETPGRRLPRCQRRLLLPSRFAAGAYKGPTGASAGGDQPSSHGSASDGNSSGSGIAWASPMAALDLEEPARLAQDAVGRLQQLESQFFELPMYGETYSSDGQAEFLRVMRFDAGRACRDARAMEDRALSSVRQTESWLKIAMTAVSRHAALRRAALTEASRLEGMQQTATEAVQRAEAVLAEAKEAAPLLGALAPQDRGLRGEVERAVARAEDTRQKALKAHAGLERARQAVLAAAAVGDQGVRRRALELVAAVYGKQPAEMEEFLAANASRPLSGSQLGRAALEAAARQLEATSEHPMGHRKGEAEEEEERAGPVGAAAAAMTQGGGGVLPNAVPAPSPDCPAATVYLDDRASGNPSSTSSAPAMAAETDPHQVAGHQAREAADRVSTLQMMLPPDLAVQRLRSEARKVTAWSRRLGPRTARAAEKAESALVLAQEVAPEIEELRKKLLRAVKRMAQQHQDALTAVALAEAIMVAAHEAIPLVERLVTALGLPLEAPEAAASAVRVEARTSLAQYQAHVLCRNARELRDYLQLVREGATVAYAEAGFEPHQAALHARLAAAQEAVVAALAQAEAVEAALKEVVPPEILDEARFMQKEVRDAASQAPETRQAGLEAHAQLEPAVQVLQGALTRVEGVRERALEVMAAAQGVEPEEVPGFVATYAYRKHRPSGAQLDREALEAVARAEGLVRGNQGAQYLAHYTYRCRNGHTYFVGGCGNPVQQATCPVCQAPVGSGSGDTRVRPVG